MTKRFIIGYMIYLIGHIMLWGSLGFRVLDR